MKVIKESKHLATHLRRGKIFVKGDFSFKKNKGSCDDLRPLAYSIPSISFFAKFSSSSSFPYFPLLYVVLVRQYLLIFSVCVSSMWWRGGVSQSRII